MLGQLDGGEDTEHMLNGHEFMGELSASQVRR